MDSTWSPIVQKAIEMGEASVRQISEMISGIAPHVWEILIKQAYADSIGTVVGLTLALIPLIVGCFKIAKWWKKELDDYKEEGLIIIRAISTIVVGCATLVISIATITESVTLIKVLINPEYYAVKQFFMLTGN